MIQYYITNDNAIFLCDAYKDITNTANINGLPNVAQRFKNLHKIYKLLIKKTHGVMLNKNLINDISNIIIDYIV